MEELKKSHSKELATQKQAYKQDLHALEAQFISDKEHHAESLKEQYETQYQEIQQAHQLAVQGLKEILQHQSLEQLEDTQAEHSKRMAELKTELSVEHESEKRTLLEEHALETQKYQEQINKLIAQWKNEVG